MLGNSVLILALKSRHEQKKERKFKDSVGLFKIKCHLKYVQDLLDLYI